MYVHHMLLYQCLSLNETTDVGKGYDCNTATHTIGNCRLGRPIVATWAVGGEVCERDESGAYLVYTPLFAIGLHLSKWYCIPHRRLQ